MDCRGFKNYRYTLPTFLRKLEHHKNQPQQRPENYIGNYLGLDTTLLQIGMEVEKDPSQDCYLLLCVPSELPGCFLGEGSIQNSEKPTCAIAEAW